VLSGLFLTACAGYATDQPVYYPGYGYGVGYPPYGYAPYGEPAYGYPGYGPFLGFGSEWGWHERDRRRHDERRFDRDRETGRSGSSNEASAPHARQAPPPVHFAQPEHHAAAPPQRGAPPSQAHSSPTQPHSTCSPHNPRC
jgi:hypothetical protein